MLDKAAKNFGNSCPLITSLHHPAMMDRHWEELIKGTGVDIESPLENPMLTLDEIFSLELHLPARAVIAEEVTDKAVKEKKQQVTLEDLEKRWVNVEFVTSDHVCSNGTVPMLKMGEEDFEAMEADLLTLQSMVSSRYEYFKPKSFEWQKALVTCSDVMMILAELQRMWSYLEPLFIGSDEVKKELPDTAKDFAVADAEVRALLIEAAKTKNVKTAANKDGLLKQLESIAERQELCKKRLNDFLDSKRQQFARFYFVSEADLLDILSNGAQPRSIMKHVDKVMLATSGLQLIDEKGKSRPSAVYWDAGVGKECCAFDQPVELAGKVEIYLQEILKYQSKALDTNVKASNKRYPTMKRIDWLQDVKNKPSEKATASDAAQIILLVAAIQYVRETDQAMADIVAGKKDAMLKHAELVSDQLKDLITLTKGKLDKPTRTKVMCMITLDAHSRDIINKLNRENAAYLDSFQWQSQIKQRNPLEARTPINILNAEFDYAFEYLGNGPRLVVTPLTDRIYVTATQSLTLMMGCAPAGPDQCLTPSS